MSSRFDFAQSYYWRMQFVEPPQQDDRQYVMLYGEEGETFGPLTMALAEAWIKHFGVPRRWRVDQTGQDHLRDSEKFA